MSSSRILVLNGPNLNLLGTREPEIYGADTLDDVMTRCKAHADTLGIALDAVQSNHEGELVDAIQGARGKYEGIIINAGAYTHTSIALRDALLAVDLPIIEVHISNLYKREEFRQHSVVADIAVGCIIGLGVQGYRLAVDAMHGLFSA